MKIKLLFFAELREIFGSSRVMEVQEGSTIAEVVDILSGESSGLREKKTSWVCAINENFEPFDKKLKHQDELALMTPMSGG